MSESENTEANLSTMREMALRGDDYRECMEISYYGMEGDLYVRPLIDEEFIPISAFLEDRLDMDVEDAQEALEEEQDEIDGEIDPASFDEEFVEIMKSAVVMGIDRTQGIAEGEDEQGIKEIVGATDDDNDIGLQGGLTLKIAERILNITSDADKAEKFRRDGGSE